MTVKWPHSSFGSPRDHVNPGIHRINKLSIFNTDTGFDSGRLPQTEKHAESTPVPMGRSSP
jgi:hypothetical protein